MREADAWNLVESALREVADIEPTTPITADTLLFGTSDLGIDSLALLDLLRIIENRLGADIDDDSIDMRAPLKVGDLVDIVMRTASRTDP